MYVSLTTASMRAGYGNRTNPLSHDKSKNTIMLDFARFATGSLSFVAPRLAVVRLLLKTVNCNSRNQLFLWVLTMVSGRLLVGCAIILYAQYDPSKLLWGTCIKDVPVQYSFFIGPKST